MNRKRADRLIGSGVLVAGAPRHTEGYGVRALMVAVLDNAISSYRGPSRQAQAEAECWMHAGPNGSLFSFQSVCDILGLEPEATRRYLVGLRGQVHAQQHKRRLRPATYARRP